MKAALSTPESFRTRKILWEKRNTCLSQDELVGQMSYHQALQLNSIPWCMCSPCCFVNIICVFSRPTSDIQIGLRVPRVPGTVVLRDLKPTLW